MVTLKNIFDLESIKKHIVKKQNSVRDILTLFDELAADSILFLVDDDEKLIGSLTDGDIRRGIIRGLGLEDEIVKFAQLKPQSLRKNSYNLSKIKEWKSNHYKIIPIVDDENKILDIVNFRLQKSYLPIHAIIMAGGKGSRLRPLTLDTPKPLLKVGNKPIIEYNIDCLKSYGVRNITLSINYLGEQLLDYFGDGKSKDLTIDYVKEKEPLGTIGSVKLIEKFGFDYLLVMNSDLLTNINYEALFEKLLTEEGDMIVATIPYEVKIPYGVIETDGERISALKEKPTYTYYSNAGIYIFKKEYVSLIPGNECFNATDLIEVLYKQGKKVIHFPILDYWLDIGNPTDFEKAQNDVKFIKF